VVVYEAADRIGGFLRYGIPDFKLDKAVLERRVSQMKSEGVIFETNARVGVDLSIAYLRRNHDAVLLACGAREAADLRIPGRELSGIHQALDYLTRQNRIVAGDPVMESVMISAAGKNVVVIGGGDTGADCVGTAVRQGAAQVLQIEIMPRPPDRRDPATPWPRWPNILRTSSSHEEGCARRWGVLTKEFVGMEGRVTALRCAEVEWRTDAGGGRSFAEKPGTEFLAAADLVLLAMGFPRSGNANVLKSFGLGAGPGGEPVLDACGMTSVPGVFIAGDLRTGASLVVSAINDGRAAAASIDAFLRMR
jgi:NADPH-dependent glutamate synthase beta subunit-like oxidoreductase